MREAAVFSGSSRCETILGHRYAR